MKLHSVPVALLFRVKRARACFVALCPQRQPLWEQNTSNGYVPPKPCPPLREAARRALAHVLTVVSVFPLQGVVVVAVLATFSAVAIVIKGGEEGGGQGNVREVSARMQRIQSLLLPQGAFESPINPYLAPNDLFLFWGESSSTGTLSSQFNGGRGRASSGQRIRQVLRLGDFTGSG